MRGSIVDNVIKIFEKKCRNLCTQGTRLKTNIEWPWSLGFEITEWSQEVFKKQFQFVAMGMQVKLLSYKKKICKKNLGILLTFRDLFIFMRLIKMHFLISSWKSWMTRSLSWRGVQSLACSVIIWCYRGVLVGNLGSINAEWYIDVCPFQGRSWRLYQGDES